MGNWARQLRLLLWKNFLIQSRRKISTLFEILLPIFFVFILLLLRVTTIKSDSHGAESWSPFKLNRTIPLKKTTSPDNIRYLPYSVEKWTIAYSPNNSHTHDIMENMKKFLDAEVQAFSTENELVKAVVTDEENQIPAQTFLCGVAFTSKPEDREVEYDLRFPTTARSTFGDKELQKIINFVPQKWYTQFVYPITFTGINPRNEHKNVGGPPPYFHEGFLSVQYAVDMGIVWTKSGKFNASTIDVQMQRFPYPETIRDNFIIVIQSSLPMLLMLSLVFSSLMIAKNIVHEKERKLKESMKMMGLSNWLHWTAWFIKCFVFLLIPMAVCTVMMCVAFTSNHRKMLNHSDPSLIFVYLMLYAVSGIVFCFFVSTLFYRSNIAAAGAGVLWFLMYVPYTFLYNYWFTMSVTSKIFSCLDFQVAMCFGAYLIGQFEGQGQGVQWSTLTQGVTIDEPFTFGHVLLMQVVDIILYGILTWYIEGIYPGEYGIPKKFYFPFSKNYWCNIKETQEEDKLVLVECDDLENNGKCFDGDAEGDGLWNDAKNFEAYPKDRKPGIELRNLRKTFKTEAGTKKAVDGMWLNFYEGEITALLGHNGAGKTTTISMLTGLFPPTSGNAVINGYDIRHNMDGVRGSLGICPQHNVLFDTLTVEEHLRFFATLKGIKDEEKLRTEVNRMIDSIGLSDKRHEQSRNLSGGMKRKLSVGIALIGDSKVVILDEPTSGMDVSARRFTWDLLQRERKGRTILLTTHFMDEADVLGDKIAIMASGRVQCYGSSLFLKKRYGVGYHMVMVKTPECDPFIVTNLVKTYVPTAELESNIGLELSFVLPRDYSREFESLFGEIEEKRKELGIASFGASVTTLEEVFIKVGEEQDTVDSKSHTALFRQLSGMHKHEDGAALKTFDAASIPFYQPVFKKNTGMTLFFQRWKAMFIKKVLHSKRHKWSLLSQLIIPSINVLLGILVVNNIPNATLSPPISLDLSMFKKEQYVAYCSSTSNRWCSNSNIFHGEFTSALRKESNSLHAPIVTNQTMTDFLLSKEQVDLAAFNLRYPVAFEIQPNKTKQGYRATGWFNNEALHTSAVSLNLLMNILLTNITGDPHLSINTRNNPLPPTTEQNNKDTRMNPVGFLIGFNQCFGMAFVASSFIVFLVQQRSSKSKHLQFVSGVDPISYWTSSYLWDLINYLLPCASIIILLAAFNQEGYAGENLLYVFTLLLMYGWAVIPFMYMFSYMFNEAATAFVCMTMLNVITGLATLLVVYILSIPSIGEVDVANTLKWVFLILPNYNLGQGMIDIFNNYQFKHAFENLDPVLMCVQYIRHTPLGDKFPIPFIKAFCQTTLKTYDKGHIDVKACIQDDQQFGLNATMTGMVCNQIESFLENATNQFQWNYLAWDNPGIGRFLIFLAAEGFIFFGIVLMIECRVFQRLYTPLLSMLRKICCRFFKRSVVYVVSRNSEDEDTDVANEKHRVNNLNLKNQALVMKDLTKVFFPPSRNPLLAVDHLSLGIPHGECFGLLGQNGAGKTTTFRMLTGDETISSGSASIDNFEIRQNMGEVRQRMGYCPQFDALIDLMTGRELLWMYCRLRGVPEDCISDCVVKLAKDLSVYEHIDKCTKTYSGGNKRKLSTAIALCGDPLLIFLDEPSSGMDPVAKRMLWNSLSEIMASGKSIVITSHSMEECEALCTRLAIMVNGQFKCLGSPQHLKTKFGEGYTLVAKIGGHDTSTLKGFIETTFSGSTLKDEHQGYIHYELKTNQSWAKLFGIMERAKEEYDIEDYSISQTTLEQVFLNFTREQRIVGYR